MAPQSKFPLQAHLGWDAVLTGGVRGFAPGQHGSRMLRGEAAHREQAGCHGGQCGISGDSRGTGRLAAGWVYVCTAKQWVQPTT